MEERIWYERRLYCNIENLSQLLNCPTNLHKFGPDKRFYKENGPQARGDSWYNVVSVIGKILSRNLTFTFQQLGNVLATFKLDGFQTGITIDISSEDPVFYKGWTRTRELTSEEFAGSRKVSKEGLMGQAYAYFVTYSRRIAMFFKKYATVKFVTVTGEGYCASNLHDKSQFPSIHPFQIILELEDKQEIVLLMTPGLHSMLSEFSTGPVFVNFNEMTEFLVSATQSHIFPVPIFYYGPFNVCIERCHNYIIQMLNVPAFEGFMITPFNDGIYTNYATKFKSPNHMRGEFSSVKRFAQPHPEDMACYSLMIDLFDRFIKMEKGQSETADEADEAKTSLVSINSMISAGYDKFLVSDMKSPMFDTLSLPKKEFYTMVGAIKNFVVDEIIKNCSECGDTIEMEKKILEKHVQSFIEAKLRTKLQH